VRIAMENASFYGFSNTTSGGPAKMRASAPGLKAL
jgi:hypothetical protein